MVFFYRYRAGDEALREIKLGRLDPLTLAKARLAAVMKRLEREQGKDPRIENSLPIWLGRGNEGSRRIKS